MPSLTDLKLQLDFDLNVAAYLAKLNTVNKQFSAQNDAHVKSYQDSLNRVAQAREKLESKFYTAEENRNAALTKLHATQQELNLSERAYYGLKKEIEAIYEKEAGITARNAQIKADANARETEALHEQLRLKNEIDRIETSNLTSSQRYAHDVDRLRKLKASGLSDDAFNAEVAKAKARYDNDVANFEAAERRKVEAAKRAQKEIYDANPIVAQIRDEQDKISKITAFREKKRKEQEAADKQARKEIVDASYNSPVIKEIRQQEGKAEFDRQKEQKRIKDETDALKEQNKVYQTINKIRTQQAAVQSRNDREVNAGRQQALGLLRSLESEEQRMVRIQDELNDALNRGAISVREWSEGLANAERRQASMASGGMRTSYVIGNLATGFEDFVTVMSITGFRMDSFAAGVRAASNNIGQAARMSGHAMGHMLAPMLSLGSIAVGFAVPAIYRWITAAEEEEKQVYDLVAAYQKLIDVRQEQISKQREIREIKDFSQLFGADDSTVKSVESDIKSLMDTYNDLITSLDTTENKGNILHDMFASDLVEDFSFFESRIQSMRNEGLAKEANVFAKFVDDYKRAIQTGNEEAIRKAVNSLGLSIIVFDDKSARELGLGPNGGNLDTTIDDDKLLEYIEKAKEQREAEGKAVADLEHAEKMLLETRQKLLQVEKEAALTRDRRIHAEQQQRDEELQKLKEQVKRSTLDGANAVIFDLSMRRREMLESGIAGPAELEGLFSQELGGRRAAILKSMRDKEMDSFSAQNNTASLVRAFTDANKQALSGQFKPEDRDRKEMLKELKAINQHLAGKKIMLEVVN